MKKASIGIWSVMEDADVLSAK